MIPASVLRLCIPQVLIIVYNHLGFYSTYYSGMISPRIEGIRSHYATGITVAVVCTDAIVGTDGHYWRGIGYTTAHSLLVVFFIEASLQLT